MRNNKMLGSKTSQGIRMDQKIEDLISEAIQKATTERGHINILIAGRSGVGKSTLINSVFQSKMAETGQGKPVTQNTREISKEGIPLTIFDTRGLEMKEFSNTIEELEKTISQRCTDKDSNRHIHVAWLCIQEDGRRVEEAEVNLHNMLSKHVPLITVITKARSDGGFKNDVLGLLPESRNVMRVRAIEEEFDEGFKLPPMGLNELIEITSEVIPEGKRRALAASQKANLKYKKDQAHKVVAGAATASAAAGASPIPMSDVAILAPIQIGMIAGITSVFGMELSKGTLSTLVSSAIGVTGVSFAGRAIVSNILKLFPGIGSIAGGAISAATASALTVALGEAYISVLANFFAENPDGSPDAEYIAEKLKEKMKGA
ncbi:DUF697 domain-containing protein [Vibrio fluvialis]|nr:DUF697 domain-containing protein [Vibrio fluvialis]